MLIDCYIMPETLAAPTNQFNIAANIALFLLVNGFSHRDYVTLKMGAGNQRKLFGVFLGKGRIHINGADEEVSHSVKVGFDGGDYQMTVNMYLKTGTCYAEATRKHKHLDLGTSISELLNQQR